MERIEQSGDSMSTIPMSEDAPNRTVLTTSCEDDEPETSKDYKFKVRKKKEKTVILDYEDHDPPPLPPRSDRTRGITWLNYKSSNK